MDQIQAASANWTFLTNHAHVLLCLAQSSSMRMRDIADKVGITERAVQHIIADLVNGGYIDRVRDGRCNVYQLHLNQNLRHPIEAHRKIAGLISFINDSETYEEETE
jgi:DNA-binding MarR family transcriptional regulator